MNSFFGIGVMELFFIALLALIVLGPERLPGAIREGMKHFRTVRNLSNELTSQFSEELKALEEINPQKLVSELTEETTKPAAKKSTTKKTSATTTKKKGTGVAAAGVAKKKSPAAADKKAIASEEEPASEDKTDDPDETRTTAGATTEMSDEIADTKEVENRILPPDIDVPTEDSSAVDRSIASEETPAETAPESPTEGDTLTGKVPTDEQKAQDSSESTPLPDAGPDKPLSTGETVDSPPLDKTTAISVNGTHDNAEDGS